MLVDTSVWSLALRRPPNRLNRSESRLVARLRDLIDEHRVLMIGAIRQELLSGVRHDKQFVRLRERLRAFPDQPLAEVDYESAAEMSNRCRAAGIASAAIDVLICAASVRLEAAILTTDPDFARYAAVLPITLLPST